MECFVPCVCMDLSIFDMFQSILVNIIIDAQIGPSLVSRSLLRMVPVFSKTQFCSF